MRKCFAVFALIAFASLWIGGAVAVRQIAKTRADIMRDCYTLDAVSLMLIEYYTVSGRWPNNWTELSEAYLKVNDATGDAWSIKELQSRVWINFAFSLDEDAKTAFGLKSGRNVHWEDDDPVVRAVEFSRKSERGKASPGSC